MRKITTLLCTTLFLALAGFGHADSDETGMAVMGDDGIQRIEILAGSYFFKPNRITVKANIPLEISVRKEPGIVPHEFVIEAPTVDSAIKDRLAPNLKSSNLPFKRPANIHFTVARNCCFSRATEKEGWKGLSKWRSRVPEFLPSYVFSP